MKRTMHALTYCLMMFAHLNGAHVELHETRNDARPCIVAITR